MFYPFQIILCSQQWKNIVVHLWSIYLPIHVWPNQSFSLIKDQRHCVFSIQYSVSSFNETNKSLRIFHRVIYWILFRNSHISPDILFPSLLYCFSMCWGVHPRMKTKKKKRPLSHTNFDDSISKPILSMRYVAQSYLNCQMATGMR